MPGRFPAARLRDENPSAPNDPPGPGVFAGQDREPDWNDNDGRTRQNEHSNANQENGQSNYRVDQLPDHWQPVETERPIESLLPGDLSDFKGMATMLGLDIHGETGG